MIIKENRTVLVRVDNNEFRFVVVLFKVIVIHGQNVRKVKKGKFNSNHEDYASIISVEQTTFRQ